MKKIILTLSFLVTTNLFSMDTLKNAFRKAGKMLNPDALVIQPEEISRTMGIFEDFIESLRNKKLNDLKRDPQFLGRIYQINCRSYQIGETIKKCINSQQYIESSKAREILINHTLATSPLLTWLTYKTLYEDGRISKETFDQYIKIEQERFYFMLTTLIPKEDEKKFSEAAHLLDKKETKITVEIIDSTKQHESSISGEEKSTEIEAIPEQATQPNENFVEQNQIKSTSKKDLHRKTSIQNQHTTKGRGNR